MSVFDVIRTHKERGDLEGAWLLGYAELQQDSRNKFLQTSLFWVVYAKLKQLLQPFKERENKTPRPNEQKIIDLWASRISLLRLELPSELVDFRLWNIFRETGKFCEPICAFVLKSGSLIFSEGEHRPFNTDEGESPSVVWRIARMVAANYLQNGMRSSLDVTRVVALIKYAQEKAFDSQKNKVFLEYDKAKIFQSVRELARARQSYISVLKSHRSESWAWFGLAATYEDELKTSLCLTCRGLTCAHDPKFSISGLVRLAELLPQIGVFDYASKALIRIIEIYKKNGWPIRADIANLTSSDWFDASLNGSDLDSYIQELSVGSDKFAMIKPAHFEGVVRAIHQSGRGITIYINKALELSARKVVCENRSLPKVGTFVKIFCDMGFESPHVVSVVKTQSVENHDVRSFRGLLKKSDKGFGFVNDDIFVYPGLVEGARLDAEVAGIAVMAHDKAKNKFGWRAITLLNT